MITKVKKKKKIEESRKFHAGILTYKNIQEIREKGKKNKRDNPGNPMAKQYGLQKHRNKREGKKSIK